MPMHRMISVSIKVAETYPQDRNVVKVTACLLMTWRSKKPGHMYEYYRRDSINVVHSLVPTRIWLPWWRHQMEKNSEILALCEGNPPVTSGFPSQRPVMQSFDVFFDLRLNKRLSKQSRHRLFETPSRSLSHHCNVTIEALTKWATF